MSFLRSFKKWRRLRALRKRGKGLLVLDRTVNPQVPLRLDVRGPISVGAKVSFGDKGAPRIADGAITLQTRNEQAQIVIGSNCAFSNNVTIVSTLSVQLGESCLIGDMVMIFDSDFHGIAPDERRTVGKSAPVRIGNNVWLGSRVMVLKGVTIGDNSVVAAGSVVVRDVPADSIAAGVPAKVIRKLEAKEQA